MLTDERIDFSSLLEGTVEVQQSPAGGYSFTEITPKAVMERLDRLCQREQIS